VTARARVVRDLQGVQLALSPTPGSIVQWNAMAVPITEDCEPTDGQRLFLSEEAARAIYEALAEHFGLAGSTALLKAHNDALALERKRVDKLLDNLIR
jgi:hypothetical protein